MNDSISQNVSQNIVPCASSSLKIMCLKGLLQTCHCNDVYQVLVEIYFYKIFCMRSFCKMQ